MPCSCGITFCPCGIPCYCLSESCKCQDCAIALSRFCRLCSKPLIGHRSAVEDACSCFIGESTVLTFDNQGIPTRRMGNMPMPINHFVTGKLIVNFVIPKPTVTLPHFIAPQPSCFIPPVKSIENNQRENSLTPKEDELKSLSHPEGSDSLSTDETDKLPRKLSSQSSDYDSSGYSSNSEQNTEISSKKIRPPPGFLESSRGRQFANMDVNTEMDAEKCTNVREKTSFYLPSVVIDNLSFPVRLEDPFWILPNSESTLKLINPFYVDVPINTNQTVTIDKFNSHEFNPNSTFETNVTGYFTETEGINVLKDSAVPLHLNKQTLDPAIMEKLLINGENIDFESSSSDTVAQQIILTSAPIKKNSVNQIRNRVCRESSSEPWQNVHWSSPILDSGVFTFPIEKNLVGKEVTLNLISKLQEPSNMQTTLSSKESQCFQKNKPTSFSENEKENEKKELLSIYSDTIETMDRLLRPLL